MNKMEWAVWALGYHRDARTKIHDDFNVSMNDLREFGDDGNESWFHSCKNIIQTLYHYSSEFAEDDTIPSNNHSSPESVELKLKEYISLIVSMQDELLSESKKFQKLNKAEEPPYLVSNALEHTNYLLDTIRYVASMMPDTSAITSRVDDIEMVEVLARRFHESVLSLNKHPYGRDILKIEDEWDCQYLFRSILAGFFQDIRDEEWSSSIAGSSARCEFFLKNIRLMIELKYVRMANDGKKIKSEIANDLLDYGGNPQVDSVIFLIYDPSHELRSPVNFQSDLSGSTKGLKRVTVVVSPPRAD